MIVDSLRTVNPYNKKGLIKRHLFSPGGPISTWGAAPVSVNPLGNPAMKPVPEGIATRTSSMHNAFKNPTSNTTVSNTSSNNPLGVVSGIASAISPMASRFISDGYDTGGVGEGISSVGSTIGSAVGTVNPIVGAAISVGSSLFGGLYNRAFGVKTNQDRLNAANKVINQNQNYVFDGDLDNMPEIASATNTNAYKGGWFSGGKARSKNEALAQRMAEGVDWANRSQENGVGNVVGDQISSSLRRIAAFGGPLNMVDDGTGAINYGFMQDYLLNKRKEAENKNKMLGMQQVPAFMPNSFAIGGVLQSNGGDFSDGLTSINAGGSHSENPNEGVQVGVDNEGVPNLVEEGETIYNDYVFSNRIEVPEEAQKWLGVKGKNLTFAEASKQLEKEIKECPNDPVSIAGFNAQIERLEEEQEFVKRCTSYSVGEVYDVDNNEMSLLNHNGYEYEKLG